MNHYNSGGEALCGDDHEGDELGGIIDCPTCLHIESGWRS